VKESQIPHVTLVGRFGANPYEVAQRYALGQIPRDEMIAALAAWPYEQDFVPSNYWDDLGISPEDGFENTVGRALVGSSPTRRVRFASSQDGERKESKA